MSDFQPTPEQTERFERTYFRPDFIAKHGDRPVPWRRLDKALARFRINLINGIAPGMAASFKKAVEPLVTRVKDLENEIADLKAAQSKTLADAFRGTWQPGSTYVRGSLAIWDGSLWLAMADTSSKCGSDDTWRMITKRGRDARGA